MTKEDALQFLDDLLAEEKEKINKTSENIWKAIKAYSKLEEGKQDPEKFLEDIMDIFYQWSEENITLILERMRDFYGEDAMSAMPVDNFFYNKDGLSPEERIERWIKECEDNYDLLFSHIVVILDTESSYMTYQIIRDKLMNNPSYDVYCEVFGPPGECGGCPHYEVGPGEDFSIIDLPPYHPDCMCRAAFWIQEKA